MEDKNIQKELNHLSPLLDQIKRERQQEVPPGYFDSLQKNILAQTINQQATPTKKFSIFRFARIAAVVVVLFGLSFWLFDFYKAETTIEPLAENEILAYIDENFADFETLEIEESLDDIEDTYTIDMSTDDILEEIDTDELSMDLFEELF